MTLTKTFLRRAAALSFALLTLAGVPLRAQQLGWEGSTGVFITPLAYTAAPSEGKKIANPAIAYHYLDGGPVLGQFSQFSITSGALGRSEFGYTHTFHATGSNTSLSPLWTDGFDTFHGKILLVKENSGKTKWVPAISVGGVARIQVRNVGGVLTSKDTSNGDAYLAASKTVTQVKHLPFLVSAGVRGTNAQLFGLGGNAPNFSARAFGSVAFVFKGPEKSTIILAGEASQQPHTIANLPGTTIPTSLVYAVRVLPGPKLPLNVDFGILQAAGKIAPTVDLQARARPAFAISYKF